jgi:hypothetical protein
MVPGACARLPVTGAHAIRAETDKADAEQLALFEAQKDCRPATERSAAARYLEPGLLELIHR